MDKIEQFKRMVSSHDLTYNYSDDGAVWRAGQAAYDAIRAAARELPEDEAARIWNEQVDAKISAGHREPFYWQPLKPAE